MLQFSDEFIALQDLQNQCLTDSCYHVMTGEIILTLPPPMKMLKMFLAGGSF